jgi:type I restriction enzyme, S subunit
MCLPKNGGNTEGVQIGKLKDFVELNPKLSIKKGAISKYVEMKDLSETSSNIQRFIEREFVAGSKFQNGDTLFARITPCLENGKTGFVDF